MNAEKKHNDRTRELLIEHYRTYPKLQAEDIFKFIFQSALGCEHLISDEASACENISREYELIQNTQSPYVESLNGEYSRVNLCCLNAGLKPETLARMFALSAKKEPDGKASLEYMLSVAKTLVDGGDLPLDSRGFEKKLSEWKAMGYPSVRHSDVFHSQYRPAYRVIANRYANLLKVFAKIDSLTCSDRLIVAIEGGSASGKTTLASILGEVYDCNVLHMDDFFLRPEQRTKERLCEIGGNVDKERFYAEVLTSLKENKPVCFRRFDCSTQTLSLPITVEPKRLTVIEGVYSMHPSFAKYYDLSVYLKIDPVYQKERILARNSAVFAKRFFEEWIPLENLYFSKTDIQARADMVLPIPIHL